MLECTDRAAVDAAFGAKAPRPFREVVLEVYPDAVEDANGRFHAPHDGYECPITGGTFSGGQFLPTEELEDPMDRLSAPSGGAARRHPTARCASTGEVLQWQGTRAQERAAWAELVAQTRAAEAAASRHVGEVGGKVRLICEVQFVKAYEGRYGANYLHVLKDRAGNVLVYKGTKKLGERGARIDLAATVKSHGEREGVAQTVVWRPKAWPMKEEAKGPDLGVPKGQRRKALVQEMLALPEGERGPLWDRLEAGDY